MSKTIRQSGPKLTGAALAEARRANGRKGGRPPGAKNKSTIIREKFAGDGLNNALASGMSPLEIILLGMREPGKVSDKRFKRAEAAAPYLHPKLNAVALKDMTDKPPVIDLSDMTDEQLEVLQKAVKGLLPVEDSESRPPPKAAWAANERDVAAIVIDGCAEDADITPAWVPSVARRV